MHRGKGSPIPAAILMILAFFDSIEVILQLIVGFMFPHCPKTFQLLIFTGICGPRIWIAQSDASRIGPDAWGNEQCY